MNEPEYIQFRCLEIEQPIGIFYIGKIQWEDLLFICYSDIRRIEKEEKNEIESYFGIQRDLSSKRINDIAQYINNIDATFPSSIILSVNSLYYFDDAKETSYKNVLYDEERGIMKLRKDSNVAKIIDGQHRVYGLKKGYEKSLKPEKFEFNVTIFIDMDLDDQSMVFATINKAQTKVNKSLVYDLFEFAKTKSPQRTSHNIVRLLNAEDGSPFKDKIKILGKADDASRETITQATLVESILEYISENPMKDRDVLKRNGKLELLNSNDKQDMMILKRRIFRNLFIENKDEVIAAIVWNYFLAVKNRWPEAWDNSQLILSKSTGIVALMKFLRPVYEHLNSSGKAFNLPEFEKIFSNVLIDDADFNTQKYLPGGSGQSALLKDLRMKAGI
jgi:DGQHR domain-containing protein